MANPQNPAYPPPPYYVQPRKSRWWLPLLVTGIIILLFVVVIVTIIGTVGSMFKKEPPIVKANSVLVIDLGKAVSETPVISPIAFLKGTSKATFTDVLRAIETAKSDSKIRGIYIKATGTQMGFAKLKEYLEAMDDFKKSGKFVYAYIETGAKGDYLRALPADKIFMPEEGMLELNGYGITGMFFKGLFDKIGVDFYVEHFEDYKSAGEMFNRTNFSDSARKNLRILLNQRYDALIDYISKYRKPDKKIIASALDRGIYTADSLKALGFIDEISSESNVKKMMKEKIGGASSSDDDKDLKTIDIDDYVSAHPEVPNIKVYKDKEIAIIYASGGIVSKSSENIFSSDNSIVASQYVKYIRQAREDNKVKAIILRIDSPGGSVIASDDIWNEITITKKVKPIYASMSDVAASGGYYIAMACDTIVAEPLTITGSIGVVSVIPNVNGLMKKLDITIDTLSTNNSSQDLNVYYPFSQRQKSKLESMMEKVYRRFVQKVADSRHKSFTDTRAIAKGRVWSGFEAKELGLVDVLGGLQTTIDLVKKRLGVPLDQKIRVKEYPQKEDELAFIKKFLNMFDEEESLGLKSSMKNADDISFFKWIYTTLPEDLRQQFFYYKTLSDISDREHTVVALPFYPVFK